MAEAINRAKLTKSYIDSISKPGFYWDTALTGFGLRISGNTKTYIVQARVNGSGEGDKRRKIGRHGIFTPEQAREHARKALHQMATGIDPKDAAKAALVANITLSQVFDDYLKRGGLKARTEKDYRGYLSKYFADWANKPLASIKPDMVEARHSKLVGAHGGAQGDVAMRFLRAIFNFASGKYQQENGDPLIAVNPTKRLSSVKLWANPRRRSRYVQEHQLKTWHAAVLGLTSARDEEADVARDYLLFLLFTGLRLTEAMTLRWENVDITARKFFIPAEDTKNTYEHPLPMTDATLEIFQRRAAARRNDFVFPGRGENKHLVEPKRAIAKVVASSGIEFSAHDLRRTFATCASTVIENPATVKRLMNHRTGRQDITESYFQGVERLRGPSQKVADYMVHLIEMKPTKALP